VLGDPEKRAAYDNMGGQDQAQFNTFWEWEQYGKGADSVPDYILACLTICLRA
jgi:DnaJ-class molecular chaperone